MKTYHTRLNVLYLFIGLIAGYMLNDLTVPNADIHVQKVSDKYVSTQVLVCDELSLSVAEKDKSNPLEKSNGSESVQTREIQNHQQINEPNNLDFISQIEQLLLDGQNEEKVHNLLSQWAEVDIQSAIDWLSTKPSTPQFERYYHSLIPTYIETDIQAAKDLITSLDESETKKSLMGELVYAYAQVSPHEALDLTNSMNDPEFRDSSQQQIYDVWVDSDPEGSLLYLSSVATDDDAQFYTDIVSNAVMTATRQDPTVATSALYQFPEQYRAKMAYGIVSGWIENDALATKDWIELLPAGDIKNQAVQSFIDFRDDDNYEDVFVLASTINKKSQRIDIISSVFSRWYKKSPEAARAALSQMDDISEEQKAIIVDAAEYK